VGLFFLIGERKQTFLSGRILEDQIAFTKLSIDEILSFYGGRRTSVVVVAHSMGGIVARGLIANSTSNARISTLISLQTPH
jgi:triacylglycerol esterase/lipase EstA (alpha/beta hydrolase family)